MGNSSPFRRKSSYTDTTPVRSGELRNASAHAYTRGETQITTSNVTTIRRNATLLFLLCIRSHITRPRLYDAEHSVMQDQRGVVPRNDRPHQNSLDEISRRYQDVKPVATVLHTGFQDLQSNGATPRIRDLTDAMDGNIKKI